MKVQLGKVLMHKITEQPRNYKSKAYKYLLPCLKVYGEKFVDMFNKPFKVAVGISDVILADRGMAYEKELFVLMDTKICREFFIEFLIWIRNQPMYVNDYVFDNIQKTRFHMIVLKFPEQFYEAFETFKKGEYSKMFDAKTAYALFGTHPEVYKVLVRDTDYKVEFTKKINKMWDTTITPEEYEGELDLPPKPEVENFNHHLKKKDESRIT